MDSLLEFYMAGQNPTQQTLISRLKRIFEMQRANIFLNERIFEYSFQLMTKHVIKFETQNTAENSFSVDVTIV